MPRNPNKIDYSGGFPPFLMPFSKLLDPRTGGNTKHHFGEIIFMVYTCILCGINHDEDMEEFCDIHKSWFKKWISLPNGIPSYNTFSRVFEAIEPKLFAECIIEQIKEIKGDLTTNHIAIDGKVLRGSSNTQDKHIHAVSAWACDEGLTLAQTFVNNKSNEITAIPELLNLLNIENTVISIDAMGTQTAIANSIIEKKGDYVMAVKGNQQTLYDEIHDQFLFATRQLKNKKLNPKNWSADETKHEERGREELRQTLVCHNLEWMSKSVREKWSNLSSVIMVIRKTNLEDGSERRQTSYYMTSLSGVKATELQRYIRNHWSIENSCHWVLDAVFREDSIQVSKRNAAKNLATARRIALNALKGAPETSRRKKPASISKKQMRAAGDPNYREQCLFGSP